MTDWGGLACRAKVAAISLWLSKTAPRDAPPRPQCAHSHQFAQPRHSCSPIAALATSPLMRLAHWLMSPTGQAVHGPPHKARTFPKLAKAVTTLYINVAISPHRLPRGGQQSPNPASVDSQQRRHSQRHLPWLIAWQNASVLQRQESYD